MIDSYKNVERLRYRLHLDLKEIKRSLNKDSTEWFEKMAAQIPSAIISAICASAITNTSFEIVFQVLVCFFQSFLNDILANIISWVVAIVSFLIIYILFFIIVRCFVAIFKRICNAHKIHEQERIDFQKEFDNIACDSVIVAFEYKNEYEQEDNIDLKEFYYFEVLHYLETACNVTMDLCKNKSYIRSSDAVGGVEQYRIYNIISLFNNLLLFLENEKEIYDVDVRIAEKIDDIHKGVEKIEKLIDSIDE